RVVAGARVADVAAVRASRAEVLALAPVVGHDDGTELVDDLRGARPVLLHEHDLVPALDELLGQVVADLSAADDQDEHGSGPPRLGVNLHGTARSRRAG